MEAKQRPPVLLASIGFAFFVAIVYFVVRSNFTSCTGWALGPYYTPMNVALRKEGDLRLVPLDGFAPGTVNEFAKYYRSKYGIAVDVASPIRLPPNAIDEGRGQLISTVAIEHLQRAHPQPPDRPLTVIGVTDTDMFIPDVSWYFALSARRDTRYAVVSSARMHVGGCMGVLPVSDSRATKRLRKMVTKNVGVLYFRLPGSPDYRSVLYNQVGGVQELDYMGEEF